MEIILNGVYKKFKSNIVLNNVSAKFISGNIYGIVGANGSGKTIILKIIAGLIRPNRGVIDVIGIKRDKDGLMEGIGCSFESSTFIDNLTAMENLKLVGSFGKISESKICKYLELLDLSLDTKKLFNELSLGMKQKVAIVQALMNDPKIIILDEPTSSLDEQSSIKLIEYLKRAKNEDCLVIITSHYISDIEKLCDTIYELENGELLRIEDIYEKR